MGLWHVHHPFRKAVTTIAIVAGSAYVLSRLLPGLAVRVGLQPRPAFPTQIGWAEPFGLIPVVGPGFSNVLAYGYPPIYRAMPAAAGTPTGATPVGGPPAPASGGSTTDMTLASIT